MGAFIYALTSIVLLRRTLFIDDQQSDDPEVVLFGFTIVVLILIVVAIVRWILHLHQVGSLIDVARRIEDRTAEAFETRMTSTCLGGHPLSGNDAIPHDAFAVTAETTGYIRTIYQQAINNAAEQHEIDVYLHAPVGSFIHRSRPTCHLSAEDDDMITTVRSNIVIDDLRDFGQDPRFGISLHVSAVRLVDHHPTRAVQPDETARAGATADHGKIR